MKKNMKKGKDKYLRFFLNEVSKRFKGNFKRAILFGSRARGDYTLYSDYDLILIFKETNVQVKEYLNELQGEMLYNYNLVFSAFPYAEEKLKQMQFEPFFINARKEGMAV